MKLIKIFPVFIFLFLYSCSSIRVNSDYEKNVDFSIYKTYAFQKRGVDKVEISDLDKKRILRAIDAEMAKKGLTKSETPDLLVSIFTKEREQVNVNQFNSNFGFGWGYGMGFGWNPFMFGGQTNVSSTTQGTLFIDLIDNAKKELVWQGEGEGYLTKVRTEKDERINEFVLNILAQFPPAKE